MFKDFLEVFNQIQFLKSLVIVFLEILVLQMKSIFELDSSFIFMQGAIALGGLYFISLKGLSKKILKKIIKFELFSVIATTAFQLKKDLTYEKN